MGSFAEDIKRLIEEWKDVRFADSDEKARDLTFTKLEEALMWAEKICK